MSRVGKYPVSVPAGTTVALEGRVLKAKGRLGELQLELVDEVDASIEGDEIWIRPRGENKKARALWGTMRSRAAGMVEGVSNGFTKNLEITGVGYRAAVEGRNLKLQVGYSHDVLYPIPEGIEITCERPTAVAVKGIDKQRVGQVAAEIRAYRPPEPYKGKGVKYAGEYIFRKEGKKK
jgi:large subunit ribosomal protein L6